MDTEGWYDCDRHKQIPGIYATQFEDTVTMLIAAEEGHRYPTSPDEENSNIYCNSGGENHILCKSSILSQFTPIYTQTCHTTTKLLFKAS